MQNHTDWQGRRPKRWPRTRQRERVLGLVREHDGGVDAAELASRMGLHVTTVRFHLDALCDQGAITRTRIARAGAGRPRTGYLAVRDRLDYQSFAEVLALELGDTVEKRRRRAERAGWRWADRIAAMSQRKPLVEQDVPNPSESNEVFDRGAAMTAEVFQRMGFSPELTPATESTAGTQQTIRLHACPVRDLARAHPEVGCALHLGLLQGLLAKAGDPEGRSRKAPRWALHAELEPFVEPELCIARIVADD